LPCTEFCWKKSPYPTKKSPGYVQNGDFMDSHYLSVCQEYLSMRFFIRNNQIEGLNKGIWNSKGDNLGSETYIIQNYQSLDQAVIFAIRAHDIASDWAKH